MKFLRHVWLARPSWNEAISGAFLWGLAMPLFVAADYYLWRQSLPPGAMRIAAIYAMGAALSAPFSLWCARILSPKGGTAAFAAVFVSLCLGTIGFTAGFFGLDFWLYFSQWHAATFSKVWAIQFIFTFGSAVYQFLVSGLRLYVPFGIVGLMLASLLASRRITR